MSTILATITAPGFNVRDYALLETDNPEQVQTKLNFLQQIADLKNDPGFNKFESGIICMTNCVVAYLECCHGSYSSICWMLFNNCIGVCQQ